MSVTDARKAPFVWASTSALAHLREHWNADRAEVRAGNGKAVYHALTEIANDDRARASIGSDSARFRTSKAEIAERACCGARSAERACRELQEIGLLLIEHDQEGENRPGRPSYYTLIEPEQTYARNADVGKTERTTAVRTTSDSSADVDPKTSASSADPPSNRKKKSKERRSVSTAVRVLPDSIEKPLRQAAEAKQAQLDPSAVRRACEALSDRDHAGEAEKFAAWHLHGNGRNAPLGNVAQGFRNWLKRSPAVEGGGRELARLKPAGSSKPIIESEAARSSWEAAKALLRKKMRSTSFHIYAEPLEAIGERDGCLVLLDTSSNGGGGWIERKWRPLILECLDGYDEIEIVDHELLELEEA